MAKGKKGMAGKGTGPGARRAISSAKKRGCSNAQIGRASNRDASTIGDIASGKIRNPPSGLAGRIRKAKCKR